MGTKKAAEIRIYLFLLGVLSMSTQVIMIREALAIFHGNELIIGLFLGIWMVLTAAGALLAVQSSKSKDSPLPLFPSSPFLLSSFSLLPLLSLLLS